MIQRVRKMVMVSVALLLNVIFAGAQSAITQIPENWYHLDASDSNFPGISVEQAYSLLKGRESKTILVAVIDSGIDTDHEDLKSVMWVNEDEIPGNGLDDDNNGYIDDIHGWSFIGGKDGTNVDEDTYEVTREYVRLKDKYLNANAAEIKKKDREEFAYWLRVKAEYESNLRDNKEQFEQFKAQFLNYFNVYRGLSVSDSILRAKYQIEEITPTSLKNLEVTGDTAIFAKTAITQVFQNLQGEEIPLSALLAELKEYLGQLQEAVEHYGTAVEYGYNPEFDPRSIVGDNYDDLDERHYGNNDVTGPDSRHGTHVAGIIGADRTNDLGMKGIADNVRIMSVRAVPNGDERDKDVANAIRYAVDNGAKIINMSFGKGWSPQKKAVDDAVQYAESKGVLLVHAAGNDGSNIDVEQNYPSRYFLGKKKKEAPNWLEVGAAAPSADAKLAAPFSNYGKKSVDLFAPGVQIYSTTPGDQYEFLQGTSMASPVVSGVAALIWSYFPELTVEDIKEILAASVRNYATLRVERPGDHEQVAFGQLSRTGGVVNAAEAVKLALEKTAQN